MSEPEATEPEASEDQYEHFNYDQDKKLYSGKSGKQRSKKEASDHTNHHDPSGHTRKTTQKLMKNHQHEKDAAKAKPEEKKCELAEYVRVAVDHI